MWLSVLEYIWIVPALPLLAFLVNGLFGRRLGKSTGLWASSLVGLAFVASLLVLLEMLARDPRGGPFQYTLYAWLPSGDFKVDVAFLIDPLTAVMLLVVTSVSMLVHLYSLAYMAGDPGFARYFTYLPLFVFSMLVLVLANNLLLLFVGWEAVGLSSYLLIGFWFHKKSASDAAKKAFIVNRIGDFGFALGIMLLFVNFSGPSSDLRYTDLFQAVEAQPMAVGNLTVVALLLFMGAMGKSAQFPLHVWLPDAMEGPTPVSALIHAATMVAAGVYMVARLNPLFALAPEALAVMALIGSVTAVLGAAIALVNNDIKRVIAYSTVSQLGYMFVGLGVGSPAAAVFHLATQAFFKALLFLGAGSVIHGLGGEQDIRRMGRLKTRMPITFWTFLVGAAANAGVAPLSGFWSKDEIIGSALLGGHWVVGALLVSTSFLTALYVFRLVFLVFFGKSNVPQGAHPHEPGPLITWPLVVLAVPAALAGFVGVPPEQGLFHRFLEPVFQPAAESASGIVVGTGDIAQGFTQSTLLMLISTLVTAGGIFAAFLFYYRPNPLAATLARRVPGLHSALLNGWYFDELYHRTVVHWTEALAYGFWRFDRRVIDGLVNGVAGLVGASGGRLRRAQTGAVQSYALAIGLGVIGLVGYLLVTLVLFK